MDARDICIGGLMKQHQQASRLLANWAALFRQEGDSETADAIDIQLRSVGRAVMTGEEAQLAHKALATGRELERLGRFEEAEEHFAQAYEITHSELGATHPRTLDRLWDLASCRMRDGQHLVALQDFIALNRLMAAEGSRQLPRERLVRRCIERCHRAVRDGFGSRLVSSYLFDIIKRAQVQLVEHDAAETERLHSIGQRLLARGKKELAATVLNRWIARRLSATDGHDELASVDLLRFSGYLRELGHAERAVTTLVGHVQMRNCQSAFADKDEELITTLRELVSSLRAQGHSKSARETAALADSIAARRHDEEQDAARE
jgi:tetratricopeptide (TPR) repeat protein